MARAKLGEELRAVVVSAGFSGRKKEGRIGCCADRTSVDFSRRDCMAGTVKRFRAVLEPLQGGLGWVVARVPFDVEKAWSKKIRLRVKVEIAGEMFRTSLFPYTDGSGYFVLVNKKMQKAAGAGLGGMVDFAMEPDLEEREAELTPEFEKILKKEKRLEKWFEELGGSMQREVGKWLAGVKSAEARQSRAEQMAERMLSAMEGEKELPPVIEVAFRAQPLARKGWEAMTALQRRMSLLAVFYYQSPEAREKRVRKVVEECLKIAKR
jgi:uncharacterized protein YdeI (YjbR/CyaY-like superfamily)